MKTKEDILQQLGYTVNGTDKQKKHLFDLIISQAMDEWLKENLANGDDKSTEPALRINSVSRSYLELMRQWFDAVQDLNSNYLNKADYNLANDIYQALGYRTPDSIFDNCG